MITIKATLLRDTFDGGRHDNPRASEWPPSWMRLFSALVSVAGEGETDLLTALESAPPPVIHAPTQVSSYRSSYVPTNATTDTTHTVLIGRTNSERGWARAAPKSRSIWYRWPALELTDAQRHRLASLCRRIPYFGRSTSPAIVAVVDDDPPGEWLIPASEVGESETFVYATTVRCPHPGALSALRSAYRAKTQGGEAGHPWEVGVGVEYGARRPTSDEEIVLGPYQSMVVLALTGGRIDGRHAGRVAHALRRTVLSHAQEHLPSLHGHHDGSVVQCAFLALPFVGGEHGDGHLLGTAIALPTLTPEELRVVASGLPAPGDELDVAAGPLGVLTMRRISPLDGRRHAWGLTPRRWTGPAKVWTTALPIVLDRYPGRNGDIDSEVRRAITNAHLPEPEEVRVSRAPFIAGGVRMVPRDTLRRPADTSFRPFRHVVVRFAQQVEGVVVVGSMRHYGLGLCAPFLEGSDDE